MFENKILLEERVVLENMCIERVLKELQSKKLANIIAPPTTH